MSFAIAKGEGGCTARPAMDLSQLGFEMASFNVATGARDERAGSSDSGTTIQGQQLLESTAGQLALCGKVPSFVWIGTDGDGYLTTGQALRMGAQEQQLNSIYRQLPSKMKMAGVVLAHRNDERMQGEYELFLICNAGRITRISSILVRQTATGTELAGQWREEDRLPEELAWARDSVASLVA